MSDDQLETVTILAGLIRKAHSYDTPFGRQLAVPVPTIAEVLEKFTSEQTMPPVEEPIEEMPKFCHCTRYDKCIIHGGAGTKNISEEANKNQGG